MLRFRHIKYFGLIAITALILAENFGDVPLWIYLAVFGFIFASILYGSFWISSQFFIRAICKKHTTSRQISLTFDDGPDPDFTEQVLAILAKHQVKATFFVIGNKIQGNEQLLKQIDRERHLIGNHTYSHSHWLPFYFPGTLRQELLKTEQLIKKSIGKSPRYFRPPFGAMSPPFANAITTLDYITIGWNMRSFDTVLKDPDLLYARLVKITKPGSIVLFHDPQPHLLPALDRYISYLKANDFDIMGLEELTGVAPYRKKPLPVDQV